MTNDDVATIRNAYQIAERKDLEAGREPADVVINYGSTFSNMHREIYRFYADGNVVVVQRACRARMMARCSCRSANCLPRGNGSSLS